jgi:hypothetical protein
MTEAEWMACADPQSMLEFLRGKASDRKLRLFAVACCRQVWHLIPEGLSREAVEVSEQYADGRVSLLPFHRKFIIDFATRPVAGFDAWDAAGFAAGYAAEEATWDNAEADPEMREAWCQAFREACFGKGATPSEAMSSADAAVEGSSGGESRRGQVRRNQQLTQCHLLRDIFGPLPFRPVAIDPTWLQWSFGTIPAIAYRIYKAPAFHDVSILADALEDAGCTDAEILDHCRGPGPHVRGCWVVDLLLGKE